MSTIRPFKAFRPKPEHAAEVAAKPYDVLNSDEARRETAGHPLSFLHVGKPEIDLDPAISLHDQRVYEKGKENIVSLIRNGILVEDPKPYLYVYAQTMDGRTQYGLVGCASVEEYWNNIIKKHEHTRKDKEEDRCSHVRVTNAHSGPIFLTYPDNPAIDAIVSSIVCSTPVNDHAAADGIRHQSWMISDDNTISEIQKIFSKITSLYVADGHHRSAAAGIVGRERRNSNPAHNGSEEYNYFLAVYFPSGQLKIMDYNRVVKDLKGMSKVEFLDQVRKTFSTAKSATAVHPKKKGEFGLYIGGEWFALSSPEEFSRKADPVLRLDVSILQNYLLTPLLGIDDPRTDKRIDFVGGIRGLEELERRVNSGEMAAAFSMYPTSLKELMEIADAGFVMPPKSTWFEPKLRDGLFVHFLD